MGVGVERQAGRFGIDVAGGGGVVGVVGAVDVVVAVVAAQSCIDLPRLGSNSCPRCLPCQVGADCTVPGAAAAQIVVEAAAASAGIGCPWAAPGASRCRLSGGRGRGCPRPARWRRAGGTSSLGGADATAAHDCLPALGTPAHGGRSSGRIGVYPGRSSVLWPPGPCGP